MAARTKMFVSDFSVGLNTIDTFVLPPYFPRNFLQLQNVGSGTCAVTFTGSAAAMNTRGSFLLPANSSPLTFEREVPQGAIHAISGSNTILAVQSDDVIPSGAPFWLLPTGNPPIIDLDFRNNRYWVSPSVLTSSPVSVSRASSGTNMVPTSPSGFSFTTFGNNVARITSPFGLLSEESRTNNLLNSTVPATQTTASLGTGTYTLWVNGSGSATPSGGTATLVGAAAATQGSPNVFTITVAGTVVVTVVGSLNAFQLETGNFGTSLIVTAGTTQTRSADVPTMSATVSTPFSQYAQGNTEIALNTTTNPFILDTSDGTTTNRAALLIERTTGFWSRFYTASGGTTGATSFGTSNVIATSTKSAGAFADGSQVWVSGTDVGTNSITGAWTATTLNIGSRVAATAPWNGYVERIAIWNVALSTATLQSLTT